MQISIWLNTYKKQYSKKKDILGYFVSNTLFFSVDNNSQFLDSDISILKPKLIIGKKCL